MNIDFNEEIFDSTEYGWGKLKDLIDNKVTVMFRIDSRFLNGNESTNKKVNL